MTPLEKRSGSLLEFDQLLRAGVSTDDAIRSVAHSYDYQPEHFRLMLENLFGDVEARRVNLARSAERRQAFAEREQQVRQAAVSDVENCYYECGLENPASAARPVWKILIERLFDRLQVTDESLKQIARETVWATVERLDRKHKTKSIRFWDY